MTPVFGHGQLRLYLLSLLDEAPRHGYEVIRALEERFDGMYSPSAGTVYPRLSRLEEEGLVEREKSGRKAVYRITEAGRAEVRERQGDLADLDADLAKSVRRLAAEVRDQVRAASRDLRGELAEAAKAARSASKVTSRGRREREWGLGPDPFTGRGPSSPPPPPPPPGPGFQGSRSALARAEAALQRFQDSLYGDLRRSRVADHHVDDLDQVLDTALAAVRNLLGTNGNHQNTDRRTP